MPNGERAGERAKLPALPLEMDGGRFERYRDVPRQGEHTREVLAELGLSSGEIETMIERGLAAGE